MTNDPIFCTCPQNGWFGVTAPPYCPVHNPSHVWTGVLDTSGLFNAKPLLDSDVERIAQRVTQLMSMSPGFKLDPLLMTCPACRSAPGYVCTDVDQNEMPTCPGRITQVVHAVLAAVESWKRAVEK